MSTATKSAPSLNGVVQKTSKNDFYSVDPRNIIVEKDFNGRSSENYGDIHELALNLVQQGQLQPASGFKNPDGTWTLTVGHRRLRAIKYALEQNAKSTEGFTDKKQIEKISRLRIMTGPSKLVDRLLATLTTDTTQLPLTHMEKAVLYKRLIDELTNKENKMKSSEAVAFVRQKMGGISQATFYNIMALNEIPEDVKNRINKGEISAPLVIELKREIKDDQQLISRVEDEIRQHQQNAQANGKKATKLTAADLKTKKVKSFKEKFTAVCEGLEGVNNQRAKALKDLYEGLNNGTSIKKLLSLFE